MSKLTKQELNHINRSKTCPVCKVGKFLEGPHGGLSINVRCNNSKCGREFNLGFAGQGRVWTGEHLDRDDPLLYYQLLDFENV